MEQIFVALQGIIIRALPTFFLVILLHWYMKKVLFQPLERVIEERKAKTEGAVADSQNALEAVKAKYAEYEKALGDARARVYQDQEGTRRELADAQAALVENARVKATAQVNTFKADLAAQVEQARQTLAAQAEEIAEQIAGAVLAGKGR